MNFYSLHNTGDTARAFVRMDYASNDLKDQVRFTALAGRTNRDVPNTFSQEDAGQDQKVESRDQNFNLGYTHVLSSHATLDATASTRLSASSCRRQPVTRRFRRCRTARSTTTG